MCRQLKEIYDVIPYVLPTSLNPSYFIVYFAIDPACFGTLEAGRLTWHDLGDFTRWNMKKQKTSSWCASRNLKLTMQIQKQHKIKSVWCLKSY